MFTVFSEYNYSSFPENNYSFSYSQNYTYYRSNNEAVYDGSYTKGNSFLGIVTKKTANFLSVKAVPYYYNYSIVTIARGSDFAYQDSGTPTLPNQKVELSVSLNTASAADSMRYDIEIFQLNGTQLINIRNYDYFVYYSTSSGHQVIEIEGD